MPFAGDAELLVNGTEIEDTFAEAFRMRFARLLVTAHDEHWLRAAVGEFTGYASSVIACDAEAGVERWLPASDTPDGRPGASVLVFGFSTEALAKAVPNRTGQCLMTCPTSAVYDGLSASEERIPLGKHIRFFGDGFQKSKLLLGRRYWRIPVMDGEFLVEDSLGIEKGVAGGNMILQGVDLPAALAAARLRRRGPGGSARRDHPVPRRHRAAAAKSARAIKSWPPRRPTPSAPRYVGA